MRFSQKIFIAVFFSTLTVGGGLLWLSYFHVSHQVEDDFVKRYNVFSDVLGDTLTQLDSRTETLMYNAARFVAEEDHQRGLLSTKRLQEIRDDLKMTHIFVVDKSGEFLRSTNEDPKLIPNVFSFCSKYRDLVTGTSKVAATPVIHPHPEPKPYKFLLVPTKTKERLIEVGVRIDFIAQTLAKALKSDSNVLSLALYSPRGMSFGKFFADKVDFSDEEVKLPAQFPSIQEAGDHYDFYTKVTSSHPSCCQCDKSGTSINGEYYYVLRSRISKSEIGAILASTNWIFIGLGAGTFLLALFLGWFLSRKLVKNIESAVEKVKKINATQNQSARINLKGNDEVSYLTSEFDRLLDTLEVSQKQVLEAEKVKARADMAKQVAHNIRSPLVAIEMMLPTLTAVPDRVKCILSCSVKDIKKLSKKLLDAPEKLTIKGAVSPPKESKIFLPVLLDEVINQKKYEYQEKESLKFLLNIEGDASEQFVIFDSTELRAIVSNLINNSVEAGASTIHLFSKIQDDKVLVTLTDNGDGISSENTNKIGRSPVTTKSGPNRGNGFVHAFSEVRKYGGDIAVKSETQKGVTVVITLDKFRGADANHLEKRERIEAINL